MSPEDKQRAFDAYLERHGAVFAYSKAEFFALLDAAEKAQGAVVVVEKPVEEKKEGA